MKGFWEDTRYALHILLKKPAFTLSVVFMLALGIGANTTIFGVVDAVLFRALPVERPEELVRIFSSDPQGNEIANS